MSARRFRRPRKPPRAPRSRRRGSRTRARTRSRTSSRTPKRRAPVCRTPDLMTMHGRRCVLRKPAKWTVTFENPSPRPASRTTAEGAAKADVGRRRAATRAADDQHGRTQSRDRPARVFAVTATAERDRRARARRSERAGGRRPSSSRLPRNRPRLPKRHHAEEGATRALPAGRAGGRAEQAAAENGHGRTPSASTTEGTAPVTTGGSRRSAKDARRAARRTQRDAFVGLFRPDRRASANRVTTTEPAPAARDGGRARRFVRSSRDRSNRDVARSRDGGDEARARRRAVVEDDRAARPTTTRTRPPPS